MEFTRILRNKLYLFYFVMVFICFCLGYILLASLDKIIYPSITELYNSIYTVYTEFGLLIFPVLLLFAFYIDYKNKNILFYKLMGYNWFKYFLSRVCINLLGLSLPTILGLIIVGLIYKDFSYFFIMFLYFESVLCFQVLLESLWGFIFKSFILGYIVNFGFWLFSIVISTVSSKLSFFARYDASNSVYINLGNYFNTHDSSYLNIGGNIIYTITFFILVIGLIYIFRKKWEKNGI